MNKHERRAVGHVSGWQEQMDTCVCGKRWPCPELLSSNEQDSTERYYAEMEAARNQGEEHYFAARPQADTLANRALFKAAFERGFGKAYNCMQRPAVETAGELAGPTWTCPNCGTVDEFSVQHEELKEEGSRVVTMLTCHACDLKCTDARSETPQVKTSGDSP